MTRLPRIIYDNAFYHVMSRGANFQNIFKNDKHRNFFLNLLDETWQTFDLRVHAYCLMGNHYHLLLQVPESNLSQAMQHIGGVYTRSFNRMEKRDGPLFRGRYKAILIDSDNYLAKVSRYIHRNPVEAKLVKKPSEYAWSSYRAYLQKAKRPKWLEVNRSIAQVSPTKNINDYQKFVENPNIPNLGAFFDKKHVPAVLGDAWFKGRALTKAQGEDAFKETLARHLKDRPSHQEVISKVSCHYGIAPQNLLKGKKGRLNIPRNIAIYLCRHQCGYLNSKIAKDFHVSNASSVNSVVSRMKMLLHNDRKIRNALNLLEHELENKLPIELA